MIHLPIILLNNYIINKVFQSCVLFYFHDQVFKFYCYKLWAKHIWNKIIIIIPCSPFYVMSTFAGSNCCNFSCYTYIFESVFASVSHRVWNYQRRFVNNLNGDVDNLISSSRSSLQPRNDDDILSLECIAWSSFIFNFRVQLHVTSGHKSRFRLRHKLMFNNGFTMNMCRVKPMQLCSINRLTCYHPWCRPLLCQHICWRTSPF